MFVPKIIQKYRIIYSISAFVLILSLIIGSYYLWGFKFYQNKTIQLITSAEEIFYTVNENFRHTYELQKISFISLNNDDLDKFVKSRIQFEKSMNNFDRSTLIRNSSISESYKSKLNDYLNMISYFNDVFTDSEIIIRYSLKFEEIRKIEFGDAKKASVSLEEFTTEYVNTVFKTDYKSDYRERFGKLAELYNNVLEEVVIVNTSSEETLGLYNNLLPVITQLRISTNDDKYNTVKDKYEALIDQSTLLKIELR